MNKSEKETFINDLIRNTQADIMSKVEQMPEEWNGIELRQYIADRFADNTSKAVSPKHRRAYKNEVLVRNL